MTVAKFGCMRDSKYDARSHIENMCQRLWKQIAIFTKDCLMGQRAVCRYIRSLQKIREGKDLDENMKRWR